MRRSAVADRYARALFELARTSDQIETLEEQLRELDDIFRENPRLQRTLENPLVTPAEKWRVIQRLLGPNSPQILGNFFRVVLQGERLGLWSGIFEEYRNLSEEHRRILEVQVESAIELLPEETTSLAEALGKRFGRRIQLSVRINPEIIGGLRIWAGDQLLDGSLAGQLHSLAVKIRGVEIQETGGR